MNTNLSKARQDIEKVEALMYAIESAYLTIETVPEEQDRTEKAHNAFYALWDSIAKVKEDIENLEGDEAVIDAVYAVNDVKRRKSSLTTE